MMQLSLPEFSLGTMEKRYQVFISSTFSDLAAERDHVFRTLMEMDCIPAGMELFPAADEEQWQFIERIIDDCDYYLLIIGGRYGSLSSEGISYTEKEFDYAVAKGLRVVALIHGKPDDIPAGKSEADPVLRAKLVAFREKVKTGRLVKFWEKADELPGLVSLSLTKTIKTYPAIGWVRANQISSQDSLIELNNLRKEKEQLLKLVTELRSKVVTNREIEDIADIDTEFSLQVRYFYDRAKRGFQVSLSWRAIFALIAPYLLEDPSESTVETKLTKTLMTQRNLSGTSASLDEQQFKTIGVQLTAYGLVKIENLQTTAGGRALFWRITEKGEQMLFETRVIRAEPAKPEGEQTVGSQQSAT
ncbi:DUF4062 domain-containing protein [Paraburkholderia sp. B3]|uniref:DUF4062 domain-containing protein n=1 Tax=Paraburkholderia sp. B3 TaxID=3134791 RepID=UPI00398297A1